MKTFLIAAVLLITSCGSAADQGDIEVTRSALLPTVTNTDGWNWYPSPSANIALHNGKATRAIPQIPGYGIAPDSARGTTRMDLSQCGTQQTYPAQGTMFMFATKPMTTSALDSHSFTCPATPACNMQYFVWDLTDYVNPDDWMSFKGVQGHWQSTVPITCTFWAYKKVLFNVVWESKTVTFATGNIHLYEEVETTYWPPHSFSAWTRVGILMWNPGLVVNGTGLSLGAYNTSFGTIY